MPTNLDPQVLKELNNMEDRARLEEREESIKFCKDQLEEISKVFTEYNIYDLYSKYINIIKGVIGNTGYQSDSEEATEDFDVGAMATASLIRPVSQLRGAFNEVENKILVNDLNQKLNSVLDSFTKRTGIDLTPPSSSTKVTLAFETDLRIKDPDKNNTINTPE